VGSVPATVDILYGNQDCDASQKSGPVWLTPYRTDEQGCSLRPVCYDLTRAGAFAGVIGHPTLEPTNHAAH